MTPRTAISDYTKRSGISIVSPLKLLLSGSAVILLGTVAGRAIEIFVRMLLAHNLSTSDFGLVYLGQMVTNLVAGLMLLEMPIAVVKHSAPVDHERSKQQFGELVATPLLFLFVCSIVGACLFYLLAPLLARMLQETALESIFRSLAIGIPAFVVLRITLAVMEGRGDAKNKVLVEDLLLPGLRLASVALAIVVSLGVPELSALFAICIVLTATVSVVRLRLYGVQLSKLAGLFRLTLLVSLLRFSLPLYLSSIFSIIIWQADPFFVQYYRGSQNVGLYATALTLVNFLPLVTTAVLFMYLPLASQLLAEKDTAQLQYINRQVGRILYSLVVPAGTILIFWGESLLVMVFGQNYSEAGLSLTILAVGYMIHVLLNLNGYNIILAGKTRLYFVDRLITGVINIVLWLILVPQWGIVGAALGSATGLIVFSLLTSIQAYLYVNVTPFDLRVVPMTALILMIAKLASSIHVSDLLVLQLAVTLCIYAILYVSIVLSFRFYTRRDFAGVVQLSISKIRK